MDSAGRGDRLDVALQQLDVGGTGLGDVAGGELEHLIGHVQPAHATRRTHPLGRKQHIDATARTEIEDAFAFMKIRHGSRIATPERREDCGVRELIALERAVQLCAGALVGRATSGAKVAHQGRLLCVSLPDELVNDVGHACQTPALLYRRLTI